MSEPIEPVVGGTDLLAMARGEPGLPGRFRWRGTVYEIDQIIGKWKTNS